MHDVQDAGGHSHLHKCFLLKGSYHQIFSLCMRGGDGWGQLKVIQDMVTLSIYLSIYLYLVFMCLFATHVVLPLAHWVMKSG